MQTKSLRQLKRPRWRNENRAPGVSTPGAQYSLRETTNIPKIQTSKGIPMLNGNTSVEQITVEHLTIRSNNSFAAVRTKLEALVPALDEGFWTLLRFGLVDRAREELEAAPTLSIFGRRDHGMLLAIAGLQRRAIQYDIGNPLTASLMTRHNVSAALYAPIRVLLSENPEGKVAFEYDRPISTFGQFGDKGIDVVAKKLDENLGDILERAAN
jgi:uncharacterized protein (DUF302 family)